MMIANYGEPFVIAITLVGIAIRIGLECPWGGRG